MSYRTCKCGLKVRDHDTLGEPSRCSCGFDPWPDRVEELREAIRDALFFLAGDPGRSKEILEAVEPSR